MKAPAAVTANRNISPMLSVNQKRKLAKINYFLHHFLKAAKCLFFRLPGRVSKAGKASSSSRPPNCCFWKVFLWCGDRQNLPAVSNSCGQTWTVS